MGYSRLGAGPIAPGSLAFDRVAFWASLDPATGRPAHGANPDGSWYSYWHGVNADGSFQGGKDPLTGQYWPGDAMIGNRPVYYDDLGPVPFVDPNGFRGQKKDFDSGFGGGANGSVFIAPPTPRTPTMVGPTPPLPPPATSTPASAASAATNGASGSGAAPHRSAALWILGGALAVYVLSSRS